jgi:phosphoribosylformylglycinamidine cyclo-ligase
MYRTFNCGVGMIVVVSAENLQPALDFLNQSCETAWHLGEIQAAAAGEAQVIIPGVNA